MFAHPRIVALVQVTSLRGVHSCRVIAGAEYAAPAHTDTLTHSHTHTRAERERERREREMQCLEAEQ